MNRVPADRVTICGAALNIDASTSIAADEIARIERAKSNVSGTIDGPRRDERIDEGTGSEVISQDRVGVVGGHVQPAVRTDRDSRRSLQRPANGEISQASASRSIKATDPIAGVFSCVEIPIR